MVLDDKDDASQYETYSKDGKVYLAKKENDDCVYLGPNGCTIYERRPIVCRSFDCRDYLLYPNLVPKIRAAALRILFHTRKGIK